MTSERPTAERPAAERPAAERPTAERRPRWWWLAAAVATVLVIAAATVVIATRSHSPAPVETGLWADNAALSRSAASEGMVLLENHGASLPLEAKSPIAVFGVGAYATVKGGTGSGDVNSRPTVSVREGLERTGHSITTPPAYWEAMTTAYDAKYPDGPQPAPAPPVDFAGVEQPLTAQTAKPTRATRTAIYVLSRDSGESADRSSGPGDYLLGPVEEADLRVLAAVYSNVVVVLNVGGIVDTSFFPTIAATVRDPEGGRGLDSLLLMGQGGQESGAALADVLDGVVDPSGRLTDTWASKYSYYPAAASFAGADGNSEQERYREGVYVGYRYFDSFFSTIDAARPASVVAYPFGYGLRYTRFSMTTRKATADARSVTVQVDVTNTGKRSGRQVVQVYASTPATVEDEPFQQLVGYAKTAELAPGASQTVTVSFRTSALASYDTAHSRWVLPAGDYVIRAGDSSRSTSVAAVVRLDQDATTQLVSDALDGSDVAGDLRSDPAAFYRPQNEAKQVAAAPVLPVSATDVTTVDARSPYAQNTPTPPDSPAATLDGSLLSSTVASLPAGQTDWEGTGSPYAAKPGETVRSVAVDDKKTLFDVANGGYRLSDFVASLSARQLAQIVEGASARGSTRSATGVAGYTTAQLEDRGVASMTLSDGPAGLRLTPQATPGSSADRRATAWPVGTVLAQTWDTALVRTVGVAIGHEMRAFGVTLWLAPGMNIHRDPLNGRNFEYYSEDPLVSGLTAAAMTEGVQSIPGIGVTVKHLFANNQETSRETSDSILSERAMREIYLRGFQIVVQTARPMAVMTSYNRVNGDYTSGSYDLDTNVLRGEWGFTGLVMTDWGAGPRTGPARVLYAGNDLIMPGWNPDEVLNALKKNPPAVDTDGLPVSDTVTPAVGAPYTLWSFNGLAPSATGAESVSTVVDAASMTAARASTATTRDALNNEKHAAEPAFADVAAAYQHVTAVLAGDTMAAAQKSGVSVSDVVHASPGDAASPVVSYRVALRGDYPSAGYPLRLGDLQRSAERVLSVVMRSAPFAELAQQHGASVRSVVPYSTAWGTRPTVVDATVGPVRRGSR
ncbi:glycoside hydrolase family 3 protein [Leifsonia sp. 2MCAF36]|uniref:glycoside hydrolase family 3 protein n=1 Tax=Leifsonia sp. 2MCAF36 TaxID=3232988 RepID=UPI003F985224